MKTPLDPPEMQRKSRPNLGRGEICAEQIQAFQAIANPLRNRKGGVGVAQDATLVYPEVVLFG